MDWSETLVRLHRNACKKLIEKNKCKECQFYKEHIKILQEKEELKDKYIEKLYKLLGKNFK